MFRSLLSSFLLVLIVSGCATSTPYVAADEQGRYGFSEQRIEADRYRIMFRGNSLTTRDTVETYLLYRAAEVTLEQGYDYFTVVSDDTEKSTTYVGTADQRLMSYYGFGRPFPYYGFGYGWGPGFADQTIRERNRYAAMANIVLGKGTKPADSPTSYNARSVQENLSARVVRPEDAE